MEISKLLATKGKLKNEVLNYQVVSISREIVQRVKKKYPNINMKQTLENFLEELLKSESK